MGWQDRAYYGGTSEQDMFTGNRKGSWSVTAWIIGICVAVFFIDALISRSTGTAYVKLWGSFSLEHGVMSGQIWRFFSYQFLHAGLLHIAFNMYALFIFGRRIEAFLGPRRYLAFYLLSGVGGAILYLILLVFGLIAKNPNIPFLLIHDPASPMVGASAGIFGVLTACAVVIPNERLHLIFPPISITMRAIALISIGIALYVVMAGGGNSGGEAAHLGGAAIGYVLIKNSRWLAFADRFSGISVSKIQAKAQDVKRERTRKKVMDEEKEVDRILAKVKESGLQSLTEKEKQTLQRATDRQQKAG